jgi:D-aminoacyl-tRNA deacylase
VISAADPVARGVAQRLGSGEPSGAHVAGASVRALGNDLYLLHRPGLHVEDASLSTDLSSALGPRLKAVIFPSMHRSGSGMPALTVHPIGNLGAQARLGGLPRRLTPVPARLQTEALLRLHDAAQDLGIASTFEATHHGPLLSVPSFFLEAGSSPTVWEDPRVHRALAALLRDLDGELARDGPIVVGVGGGHYVPRFRDLVRHREVAVGHLVPDHHVSDLDARMWEELVRQTPQAEGVLLARPLSSFTGPPGLPVLSEQSLPRRAEEDGARPSRS